MLPENSSLRVNLGQLGRFLKGKGITKADLTDTGVPCLRYAEIYTLFENVVTNLRSFVNPMTAAASTMLTSGDIVFAASGETAEEIGKAVTYLGNSQAVVGGDTVILRNHAQDPFYLVHAVNSRDAAQQKARLGKGHSVVHIHAPDLAKIEIYLPPLPEQRKIAEIISTWDRAIETTEKLIASSEAQKKALMQQLLTGKKRLPGFKGEWQGTTLEKVAQIIVSNVDKKSEDGAQPVRLCNYMDVYRTDRIEADMPFMRATAAGAQIKKFGLRVGDVLITKDSETPDDIAVPSYVASTAADLVCGYHLAIIRPKKDTDGQFLKYYFEDPNTQHFFASRANGATRFGLTVGTIESAPINLPSFAEQKRIGDAISTAEFEIRHLLPIAETLRQEKSALMQQLLTGKRRVKIEEVVA